MSKSHPDSINSSLGQVLIDTEGTEKKKIQALITVKFVGSVWHINVIFWAIPDPFRISSAMSLLSFWRDFLDALMWNLFGMFGNCRHGKTTHVLSMIILHSNTTMLCYHKENTRITCMTKIPQLVTYFWRVWVILPGCHLTLTQSSFPSLFRHILKYCLQVESKIFFSFTFAFTLWL